MDSNKKLTLISTIVGFSGSMFLAIGVLYLTPDIIAERATTKTWYNPQQLDNIANQKANFECGIGLVALAFIIQIVNLTVPHDYLSRILLPNRKGILFVILVSLLLLAYTVNGYLVRKHKFDSHKSLAKNSLIDSLKDNKISDGEYEELMEHAKKYLGFEKRLRESSIGLLRRYADFLYVAIPASVDLGELEKHK